MAFTKSLHTTPQYINACKRVEMWRRRWWWRRRRWRWWWVKPSDEQHISNHSKKFMLCIIGQSIEKQNRTPIRKSRTKMCLLAKAKIWRPLWDKYIKRQNWLSKRETNKSIALYYQQKTDQVISEEVKRDNSFGFLKWNKS